MTYNINFDRINFSRILILITRRYFSVFNMHSLNVDIFTLFRREL